MTALYQQIARNQTALIGEHGTTSYAQLLEQAGETARWLEQQNIQVLALLADNSPGWLLVDLACQMAGVCFLPLPHFFSNAQIRHCLKQTGCRHVLSDDKTRLAAFLQTGEKLTQEISGFSLLYMQMKNGTSRLPEGTAKITFTSGSTGEPKGVCLNNHSQQQVAQALDDALAGHQGSHLCLLPLSTLLENVAGAYRALLADCPIHLPSASTLGFNGASVDMVRLTSCIDSTQPATLILVPELLGLLNRACRQGWHAPRSLRFVAVGGARVSPQLLLEAQCHGLPVYEGYGLSECCSVVSLNTPGSNRPGTAGRLLSHQHACIEEGQIKISGNCFLGYVNQPQSWYPQSVPTGDLGWLDHDGFLHTKGRAKNLIISSFGRNINPEWLESELLACDAIQQAAVFGDREAFCSALLYCAPATDDSTINHLLQQLNKTLPEYARIQQWRRLPAPMTADNKLVTGNGRPRRQAIARHYQHFLDDIYHVKAHNDNEVQHHDIL